MGIYVTDLKPRGCSPSQSTSLNDKEERQRELTIGSWS
jgi:hypothetical protein